MKKTILIFVSLLLISCSSNRVKNEEAPNFIELHGKEYFEKTKLSSYLVMYDKIAWNASDTLMKYEKEKIAGKMGEEWFIYLKGEQIICVFGKYENGLYKPFVRYTVNNNNEIVKTNESDSITEYKYSKAINTVKTKAYEEMKKQNHKYNWYVYTDSLNGSINVLYLPEIGKNFEIIYGNEFSFVLDKNAESIVLNNTSNNKLKYFMLDKKHDIQIFDRKNIVPEIGYFYVAERWINSTKAIYIKTNNNVFTLVNSNGSFAWIVVT